MATRLQRGSVVAISSVTRTVADAVIEAMELASWRDHVPAGVRVALKPNLCWDLPLPGAQTSPWFLDAVIETLLTRTRDIVIVEAGQVTVDADVAFRRCGMDRIAQKHGIPFVNMSRGQFHRADLDGAAVLMHVDLPEVLSDRMLITLPVLKTHGTTTISGALKNQWGCLRELRHNYHLVLDDAIADANLFLRPSFAVMDGTVALEGNGPKTGRPRVADLVLASADLVALDATAARLMGLDPRKIPHVRNAARRGLGALDACDISVVGRDLESATMGFRAPRLGLVARTEFAIRRSRLRRLAFETGLLSVLAFAAKAYNATWYAFAGRRRRRRIIAASRYGPQWLGQDEPEPADGGAS